MNEDPDVAVQAMLPGIRYLLKSSRFRMISAIHISLKGNPMYACNSPRNAEVLYQESQPKERAKNLNTGSEKLCSFWQR